MDNYFLQQTHAVLHISSLNISDTAIIKHSLASIREFQTYECHHFKKQCENDKGLQTRGPLNLIIQFLNFTRAYSNLYL